MSKTADTTTPLIPSFCYHLFNRGNNKQNIFYKEKNYSYFLAKYAAYMDAYLDTFAYCLLPNHFHLLVRVKEIKAILEIATTEISLISKKTWLQWEIEVADFEFPDNRKVSLADILKLTLPIGADSKIASWAVSEKTRRWLMGYAKSINKQEDLEGSLFRKTIRRIQVTDMDYLKYLVWYLHNNPVHHDVFHSLQDYTHSSYQSLISEGPSRLKRKEVLKWFGGVAAFIQYHKEVTLGYANNDIKFWME